MFEGAGSFVNHHRTLPARRSTIATALVAPGLLLAEEDVPVLVVGHRRVNVGAPGDVGTGRYWLA
jgi:hypothetical protein